ncbi:hypothetical protein [Polyangium sp. 15x6]|uniref:hypothetical protein n=1 Tax=Polyangium sp. 15x6 TaxID=3042687 RepID=UPI00249BF728|nr:hypothetical protein [Polyangium sp. 15x6]MDI3284586.1 hypothetical protein [Polyangium sp. 15x6]
MLRILREQVDALRQAELEEYRERVIAQIQGIFPAEWSRLGEEGCGALVDRALGRAARHGCKSEQDVFRYVSLMLVLGPDFEEDPALPWVREILEDPEASGWQKVSALMDRAIAWLRERDAPKAAEEVGRE